MTQEKEYKNQTIKLKKMFEEMIATESVYFKATAELEYKNRTFNVEVIINEGI